MKNMFLGLSLMLLISACSPGTQGNRSVDSKESAKKVIFDTDLGNDIDDVLALQMLFNYEKENKVDLLGITISKSNPNAVPFLDGYCRFNNRGEMPIGYAYNGVNPETGVYLDATLEAEFEGQKVISPQRTLDDNIPEGYVLLRRILVEQPDSSVTLIAVGPLTNIARLLDSQPDSISPLDGIELVRQKVQLISLMSGSFTGEYDFPEWNVIQDLPASRIVYEKSPVPLITSGFEIGMRLCYPSESIMSDFGNPKANPLCVAYQAYMQMPYNRQTWDLTAVLEAVEPDSSYFELSPTGVITLDDSGFCQFEVKVDGLHRFLRIPSDSARVMQALIRQTVGI
jgi:inosine-uridine nucleoside N-ribohydrolase